MEIHYTLNGLRAVVPRRLGAALLAAVLTLLTGVPPGGNATALASNAAMGARDLPLPKRWNARYIDEPVFDTRVYVVEAGRPEGPPVLLVHGLGQSGYQDWWEVMHGLETTHRLVALDLPGFARSGTPAGELSPARYARLLDWLVQHLGLSGVNLVGHSMGGAIALYQAGAYPSPIANVVLIDAAGVLQRVAFLREIAREQVAEYGLPPVLAEYKDELFDWGGRLVERFIIQTPVDVTQILRRSDRRWNAMLSDRPNINAAVSLLETDFSPVLSGFNRPVTIIWGSRDSVTPVRTGHLLHSRLSASELHVIEGAGHVPMRTHTNALMERLRRALADPPRPKNDRAADVARQRDNLVCSNEAGRSVSGDFDRIVIDRCPGMRLVDVTARLITISGSDDVHLRHVTVDGEGVAVDIHRSNVIATDLKASGDPAVRADSSRVDIAGGVLAAPGAAFRVARPSTVILSVSEVDSGVRKGALHGAVLADDAVLDDVPALRSQ